MITKERKKSSTEDKKLESRIESIRGFFILFFFVLIFCILAPIYMLIWNRLFRLQGSSKDEDIVSIAIVYPPLMSAEDTGELFIVINHTGVTSSSISNITTTLLFDPRWVILEDTKNTWVITDVLPNTIHTYQIPFRTTGLISGGTTITKTNIAVENRVQVGDVILNVPMEIPLEILTIGIKNLFKTGTLPGFHSLWKTIDLKVFMAIVSALASIMSGLSSWWIMDLALMPSYIPETKDKTFQEVYHRPESIGPLNHKWLN
jgi:hypothetical protein